jgi:hypothetical protein
MLGGEERKGKRARRSFVFFSGRGIFSFLFWARLGLGLGLGLGGDGLEERKGEMGEESFLFWVPDFARKGTWAGRTRGGRKGKWARKSFLFWTLHGIGTGGD